MLQELNADLLGEVLSKLSLTELQAARPTSCWVNQAVRQAVRTPTSAWRRSAAHQAALRRAVHADLWRSGQYESWVVKMPRHPRADGILESLELAPHENDFPAPANAVRLCDDWMVAATFEAMVAAARVPDIGCEPQWQTFGKSSSVNRVAITRITEHWPWPGATHLVATSECLDVDEKFVRVYELPSDSMSRRAR